jgi:hypothetical protein
MDDQEFLNRMKAKIERMSGKEIRLHLDTTAKDQLKIGLERPVPEVTLGSNVLQYSGFARMAIEYSVACIREMRELGTLEFHALLARN